MQQELDFYNTTNLTGEELAQERANCKGQEKDVLDLYHRHNETAASPEDIHQHYNYLKGDNRTPLTSIRRAITTLTKKGLLVKTDEHKIGQYGKKIYLWRVAS